MFQPIVGLIWDFDGVILPESELVNIAAGRKTFFDLGLPLTSEEVDFIPGKSSKTYVPPLLRARGIASERDEEFILVNRANYDKMWPGGATLATGFIEVLTHFMGNDFSLALATSNRRVVIDRFLKSMLPIPHPFRLILTGEDVKRHKPDPEIYAETARRMGIPPDLLLAVEDTEVGVASAKGVPGLRCAAIPNRFSKNQDFSKADYKINSLYELIRITGGEAL